MKLTGFASSIILRPKNSKSFLCITSSDTALSLFWSRIRSLTNRSISSNLIERMLSSFSKMGARFLNSYMFDIGRWFSLSQYSGIIVSVVEIFNRLPSQLRKRYIRVCVSLFGSFNMNLGSNPAILLRSHSCLNNHLDHPNVRYLVLFLFWNLPIIHTYLRRCVSYPEMMRS